MSTKLKLLPLFVMLLAGAFTSIITFLLHYEWNVRLWILAGVLVLFYILGLVVQKVVHKFEEQIAEEEAKRAEEEEGKVVEKEGNTEDNAEGDNTSDAADEGGESLGEPVGENLEG